MQTIPSKIHKVTIFSDRAQVTRQAEISLEAGEYTLLFDEIPDHIIENSVQVNGKGEASLKQVQIKTAFQKIKLEEDRQKLIKNKKKIEDDLRKLEDNQERLQKEKEFLDQIIQHTTASQSITAPELNPERWEKLFAFQQEKRLQIDEQTFEIEKKQEVFNEKLNEVKRELSNWGSATQKTVKQAEVNLTLNTAATIQLELSYVVRNAGWYPIYDLRVSTETKKMTINYQAIIFQNTQEDWQDVKLQLSTAQPQISGKQPELNPWRLNFYLPPAAPMMQAKKRSLAEKARSSKLGDSLGGMANQMYNVGEVHDGAAEMDWMEQEQERAITMPETKVETKTTAVFFDIAGEHSILSKGTDHRVGITQEEFSAHFRYSTVPKLSPYAYLKTKVVNTTNYPLLKGEAQVFLDNNFVATSHLETVAPSEEFWTFLGIDEGFKVKHKFVKKYEKQAGGVFAKKTKTLVYEYLITVKSHKKTSEEMVVWDQLPISQNNDIKVELISPIYKSDTDKLKKNDLEYLEWFYQMKAGEEVEIPFKFSVEYPQNQSIMGLD